MSRGLRHGSLFSGIGGFDVAAELMGWENVFHCEIEEFPRKILKYYWPNATSYEDIKQSDFSIHRGNIDIITGGFPCQPYSTAGKRKGKDDDRHLWPNMLDVIRTVQPRWVVGENVYGLVNWNEGLVFEEVQSDLEDAGYEVQPFVLPAAGVGAPHRRERIWFVAYSKFGGTVRRPEDDEGESRGEGVQQQDTVQHPGQPTELRSEMEAHATNTQGVGRRRRGSETDQCEGRDGIREGLSNDQGSCKGGSSADTTGNRRKRKRSEAETKEGCQQESRFSRELEGRPEGLCGRGSSANTESRGTGGLRVEGQKEGPCHGDELPGESCGIPDDAGDTTYPNGQGLEERKNIGEYGDEELQAVVGNSRDGEISSDATECGRFQSHGQREPGQHYEEGLPGYWDDFPTQPPVCSRDDGIFAHLHTYSFPRWRRESVKAYGNAIVPHVVLQIFKAIEEYEKNYR